MDPLTSKTLDAGEFNPADVQFFVLCVFFSNVGRDVVWPAQQQSQTVKLHLSNVYFGFKHIWAVWLRHLVLGNVRWTRLLLLLDIPSFLYRQDANERHTVVTLKFEPDYVSGSTKNNLKSDMCVVVCAWKRLRIAYSKWTYLLFSPYKTTILIIQLKCLIQT